MKDCLRSYNDDEAREMRIVFLTMRLHAARSQEDRREIMRELEEMKAEKVKAQVSK